MNNLKSRRGNKLLKRYVFRKSKSKRPENKSLSRLILEALIMSLSGTWLILSINQLPLKYDFTLIINEATSLLYNGLSLLTNALFLYSSILLVAALVALGLLLLIGAIWRILKVLSIAFSKSQNLNR